MSWSFSIGRVLGSELRVHVTFLLLLAWIGYTAWNAAGMAAAVSNMLFILALFACVVAHEFGHALMARRYGIRTPDIMLLPIGGLARLERMPRKPSQELAVALAGPAVNVVIAAAIYLSLGRLDMTNILSTDSSVAGFLARLAAVNVWLVLFNLIPAFPMDGGRVLRAVLAFFTDWRRATRVAAFVGQALAVAFAAYGVYTASPLLVLIALFVFLAARAEGAAAR